VFERGSRHEGKARYASTLAHHGERFAAEAASFGPMKLCRFLISGELRQLDRNGKQVISPFDPGAEITKIKGDLAN